MRWRAGWQFRGSVHRLASSVFARAWGVSFLFGFAEAMQISSSSSSGSGNDDIITTTTRES